MRLARPAAPARRAAPAAAGGAAAEGSAEGAGAEGASAVNVTATATASSSNNRDTTTRFNNDELRAASERQTAIVTAQALAALSDNQVHRLSLQLNYLTAGFGMWQGLVEEYMTTVSACTVGDKLPQCIPSREKMLNLLENRFMGHGDGNERKKSTLKTWFVHWTKHQSIKLPARRKGGSTW
jgi:hypothetical protein